MIAENFEYSAPATLQDALVLLAGGAKPLAGGMSLIPLMKLRLVSPGHVVDLSRVGDLRFIREEADGIHIGAMTTYHDIETSSMLRDKCPLMPETAKHIGDIQVRNMGTLGGSIAHADPAADYPAALMALEARIRLARASGERTLSIEDFLVDTMTTALESGELVREIIVPAERPVTGVSYQKMKQPASGFAIVGVAVRLRRSNGSIDFARVGVTGMAPKAFRALEVEQQLTAGKIDGAASAGFAGIDANSDLHASGDYRRAMARVYADRAIRQALARMA